MLKDGYHIKGYVEYYRWDAIGLHRMGFGSQMALKHPKDALKVLRNGVPESSEVVLGRLWEQDALPEATLGGQREAKVSTDGCQREDFGVILDLGGISSIIVFFAK